MNKEIKRTELIQSLSALELDRKYPHLRSLMKRTSKVVAREFRAFRPDVDLAIPPLLLWETAFFAQEIAAATRNSSREEHLPKRSYIQFEAISGRLDGSIGEIKDLLSRGEEGTQPLTLIIAEECIHALSTFGDGNSTRCGFLEIPLGRKWHGLQPGKIYECKYEQEASWEADVMVFREDEVGLRLTENTTKLVGHLMLNKLLPGLKDDYRFMILRSVEEKAKATIIKKDEYLLHLVICALCRGDLEILKKALRREVSALLETPGFAVASLKRFPQTEVDDIFPFS